MSNQNVPWANRGRGGGHVGVGGRSATVAVTPSSTSSSNTSGTDGEEKKAFPFGERVVRRTPTTTSPAPAPTASTSSPFGERLKKAGSITNNNPSPTPAEKKETAPAPSETAAAPKTETQKQDEQSNTDTSDSADENKKAEDGSSVPAHLRKPPRTMRGSAPTDIFAERVSLLANSPRKEKIVYTQAERKELGTQSAVEQLDPSQIDDMLRLSVSGEALAMLSSSDDFRPPSPKAEKDEAQSEDKKEESSTPATEAPTSTENQDLLSASTGGAEDVEVEVPEEEKELAKEGAFCEGGTLLTAEAAEGLTVTECIDVIVKMVGSPRLQCAEKTRPVRRSGSRKPPSKKKSSLASSGKAASLPKFDYKPSLSKSDLAAIPTSSQEQFAIEEQSPETPNAEAETSPEVSEGRERSGSDGQAKIATLRNTSRQFTLSAQDLLKTSLKKKPQTEKPPASPSSDEGANMLSRLKRSGSIGNAEKKDDESQPTFGSTLKKVMSKEDESSPAAKPTDTKTKEEESKGDTGPAWAKNLKKKEEPKKEEEKPKEEPQPAASTGPAWTKNLKKSSTGDLQSKEQGKPKEEPAPQLTSSGPAWAKNLKKSPSEDQKTETTPASASAAKVEEKPKEEPSATSGPAWAKNLKKSPTTEPKEQNEPATPTASTPSGPAWAKNVRSSTTAPAPKEEKPAPTPAAASASGSTPAWAKNLKKSPAEEEKPKTDIADASSGPAWAKNLKKPSSAPAAEETKSEAPASTNTTAEASGSSSVSAAAAMFGGRGKPGPGVAQRSFTTSALGRGK